VLLRVARELHAKAERQSVRQAVAKLGGFGGGVLVALGRRVTALRASGLTSSGLSTDLGYPPLAIERC
jgi:hypothetical protein